MVGVVQHSQSAWSLDDVVALSAALRTRQLATSAASTKFDDIPPLTRALSQVHADSIRLLSARVAASAPTPATSAVHPAALRLFASVGFEADRLRRAVGSVENLATFADAPARTPGTRRQPDWLAARALDDARLSMNAAFRHASSELMQSDLEQANRQLVSDLASRCDLRAMEQLRSMPATPTTPHTPRTPRTPRTPHTDGFSATVPADGRYLDAVRSIALHGDGPSAPSLMHETASSIGDAAHFVEMLAIVACVARHSESDRPPGTDLAVWGARAVLEDQYAERIGNLPAKPRLAAPPAVIPCIRDYVQMLARDGRLGRNADVGRERIVRLDGVPLWPQVYMCMRIGNVDAALAVLEAAERAQCPDMGSITQFMRLFVRGRKLIEKIYCRGREARNRQDVLARDYRGPMAPGSLLGEDEYESLHAEYQALDQPSGDVYRRACYVLLSRLELLSDSAADVHGVLAKSAALSQFAQQSAQERASLALSDADYSFLFSSVEDYMWFRLWLCRTPSELQIVSALTGFSFVSHAEIQNGILSCGGDHFNPEGTQPLVYAFVLVAAGLYEEAVRYLSAPANEQWVHYGVHFALVLYHLPWMRDEDSYPALLSEYVSFFSRLYPTEAALYLLTIRKREILLRFLRELIISTREFSTLLGTSSGEDHIPGALEELISSSTIPLLSGLNEDHLGELRNEVSSFAARKAEEEGDFAFAAQMFNLAGQWVLGARMIMKNLAEEVHKRSSPRRPLVLAEARSILRSTDLRSAVDSSSYIYSSLEMLIKMSRVFDDVWMGRFGSAWAALSDVGILPLTTKEITDRRREWSRGAEKFDPCIWSASVEFLKMALHIAEYALETGNATRSQNETISGNYVASPRSSLEPRLPDCSEIRSLCTFAGVVGIADSELNAQLVRIELLLS